MTIFTTTVNQAPRVNFNYLAVHLWVVALDQSV